MEEEEISNQGDSDSQKKTCGIIMPIAPHADYPQEHWKDVLNILTAAINETEFQPRLVSDDVAIGLIHDRIVTNIYNNEIVICDVSSKNPNVMFELGLRLAFDKPTIIIKDDLTGYSFDTGVIEHLTYPSSLRFGHMVKFKEELVRRINATYKKSVDDEHYSPFLKSFGKKIVPASINQTEIPEGKYIIAQLNALSNQIQTIRTEQQRHPAQIKWTNQNDKTLIQRRPPGNIIKSLLAERFKEYESGGYVDKFAVSTTLQNELENAGFYVHIGDLKAYVDEFFAKRDIPDQDA